MKTRLLLVILLNLTAVVLRAGVIITLDQPNQTGPEGATLQDFGTFSNMDANSTVFLNLDSLNVAAVPGDFTVNDLFFSNVPVWMEAGANSGLIELFEVSVSLPFGHAFTSYSGSYQLVGGIDGDAQDVLGSVTFSVTPISTPDAPEPGSVGLIAGGLLGMIVLRVRRGGAGALRRFHVR